MCTVLFYTPQILAQLPARSSWKHLKSHNCWQSPDELCKGPRDMLVSVGEEILARTFTNLDFATCWNGEEPPGAYMLALIWEINRCDSENLPLTLSTHRAIVKGPGIYVSIGQLRKESLRELTANPRWLLAVKVSTYDHVSIHAEWV